MPTDRIPAKSDDESRRCIRPQLQFVTQPSDFNVVTDVPLKQGTDSPVPGRRTRFAAAKKRKLFDPNAQDIL
jgi:hypothetical protein